MVTNTDRRNFIAGAGAAAASTAVLAGTQALARENHETGAKVVPYQAMPMPFDPKSITGISEKWDAKILQRSSRKLPSLA